MGVKETLKVTYRPVARNDVFLHICTDGKAETGGENRVETGSGEKTDPKLYQSPKLCMYAMI